VLRARRNGVLVSWAVPKGPTLDPATKRFATMTEDHPLEYADFEGVIPEGEYEAGNMIVWDHGEYETDDEIAAEEQVKRGDFKVILYGKKLQGEFVLVHMGRRAAKPREKSRWLLIKKRDEYARSSWSSEDTKLSRSVVSGLTLKEIAHRQPTRKRAA
jgi:bifunctional non-homologous end joining protein LigD